MVVMYCDEACYDEVELYKLKERKATSDQSGTSDRSTSGYQLLILKGYIK